MDELAPLEAEGMDLFTVNADDLGVPIRPALGGTDGLSRMGRAQTTLYLKWSRSG